MNIAIVGLGLIGGSIAIACKNAHIDKVIAYDSQEDTLVHAQQKGYIDVFSTTIDTNIIEADIIIIAVPIASFSAVLKDIKPYLTAHQIITDVCSVKNAIVNTATSVLADKFNQFVPCHPMAGSEKSGIQHAKENLFAKCNVILTPTSATNLNAIKIVTDFWEHLGAITTIKDPVEHDAIVAATSHLPHVISFAFSNIFFDRAQITNFGAGSYRDMTRIAASDTKLWCDIFLNNKNALAAEIVKFKEQIEAIQNAIISQDKNLLTRLINREKNL